MIADARTFTASSCPIIFLPSSSSRSASFASSFSLILDAGIPVQSSITFAISSSVTFEISSSGLISAISESIRARLVFTSASPYTAPRNAQQSERCSGLG